MDDPDHDFAGILNFRDVGKTINGLVAKRIVKEGLFYRSARPDDATAEDRRILQQVIGMKTVIDLRTKTEHVQQAEKRKAALAAPALLQTNAAAAEPLQIPGLTYHEIKITGRRFELFLVRQLSWLSFIRFLFLLVFGYRLQAISIFGREILLPRGLVGLGLDTMDQSGREIAAALRTIIEPSALPLLVHCTQGKDRTGLIVALVLMVLDVPVQAIERDYALTDGQLESEREQRLKEIREIGLTDDWFLTDPALISSIARHLEETYGGLDRYLDGIGFGKPERHRLRDLLLY